MFLSRIGTFACACWALTVAAASVPAPTFFRSDHGLPVVSVPLPGDLNSPDVLRWRVVMDSGHSSPVLSRGKVFLTTYRSESRELATVALSAQTGQMIWKQAIKAEHFEQYHPATGSPVTATPACDGERLYVFFGSYGLICYGLDGRKLWERRMGPFQDEFGASSSPVIVDNKVILCEDHDRDSFLLALDSTTGNTVWKRDRPDAVRSYSTPAVWSPSTQKELLVAGALELAAYDPTSGDKLWWVQGLARIVIPVPVPAGEMVYLASWTPGGDVSKRLNLDSWPAALAKWDRDHDGRLTRSEIDNPEVLDRFFRMDLDQSGDLDKKEWDRHAEVFRRAQNAVLALKPAGRGDLTGSALVWKYQRGVPYVASPLVANGIYWMVKDGGIVTKLDAAGGQLIQEERLPGLGGYYASPVAADRKVYFASELGLLSVVANEKDWRVISSHDFREKIYATLALAGDRIFVRTENAVYCFGLPASGQ